MAATPNSPRVIALNIARGTSTKALEATIHNDHAILPSPRSARFAQLPPRNSNPSSPRSPASDDPLLSHSLRVHPKSSKKTPRRQILSAPPGSLLLSSIEAQNAQYEAASSRSKARRTKSRPSNGQDSDHDSSPSLPRSHHHRRRHHHHLSHHSSHASHGSHSTQKKAKSLPHRKTRSQLDLDHEPSLQDLPKMISPRGEERIVCFATEFPGLFSSGQISVKEYVCSVKGRFGSGSINQKGHLYFTQQYLCFSGGALTRRKFELGLDKIESIFLRGEYLHVLWDGLESSEEYVFVKFEVDLDTAFNAIRSFWKLAVEDARLARQIAVEDQEMKKYEEEVIRARAARLQGDA